MQRPIGAFKADVGGQGMPGIVTTPTMPVGPTSSLTAMVPVERTSTGFSPTGASAFPLTWAVAPGASAPVTRTVCSVAVTTDALKRSVALEVFMKAMLSADTLLTGTWAELPGRG